MALYNIIRHYRDRKQPGVLIKSGLTLEEAQAHCNDPSTREDGVWFDGYQQEGFTDFSKRVPSITRALLARYGK